MRDNWGGGSPEADTSRVRSCRMPSMRVRLTFPGGLIKEPVIYNVGQRYDVVTNIRRANVEREAGWVVMEMSGSDVGLDEAVEYLREVGVEVEPVGGDVVAS